MTRFSVALLALLVPTALAVPRFSNQPTGFSTGVPVGPLSTGGSAAPYGQRNSTRVGPIGTGTAPAQPRTVTVVPLPVSSSASEGDIVGSKSVSDVSAGGGNTEVPIVGNANSPLTGKAPVSGCGVATTITVTSANTVTVTVGAASVGSSGPASQPPVTTPIASQEATTASLVPFANGTSVLPIGTESVPGTAPAPISTGASVAPVVHVGAHGYKHLSFHAKYSTAQSSPIATPSSEVAAPTSTPASEGSILSTPKSLVSSNTLAGKSGISTPISVVPAPSSTPASASSSTESLVVPVPSSTPAPPSSPAESVVIPTPSSSTSITPESVYTTPTPKEIPTSTSASQLATSSAAAPKSYAKTPSAGTKRGLVYNTAALTDLFSDSSAISWAYNWDSQPGGTIASSFNFVPQLWGPIEVHTTHWKDNADKALAGGATHLLGFNEPDIVAQANLSPQAAAEHWITYMEPYAGKAKLGSPAVCNSDAPNMGLHWLNDFLSACGSRCTVDFFAIHWYGESNDAGVADLQRHIAKAAQQAGGRELWLTEFQPSGSAAEQADFLAKILPWLDDASKSGVARYAYFEVDGILTNNGGLTDLGSQYAS